MALCAGRGTTTTRSAGQHPRMCPVATLLLDMPTRQGPRRPMREGVGFPLRSVRIPRPHQPHWLCRKSVGPAMTVNIVSATSGRRASTQLWDPSCGAPQTIVRGSAQTNSWCPTHPLLRQKPLTSRDCFLHLLAARWEMTTAILHLCLPQELGCGHVVLMFVADVCGWDPRDLAGTRRWCRCPRACIMGVKESVHSPPSVRISIGNPRLKGKL